MDTINKKVRLSGFEGSGNRSGPKPERHQPGNKVLLVSRLLNL